MNGSSLNGNNNAQRRRGSGINNILNTFGIRPATGAASVPPSASSNDTSGSTAEVRNRTNSASTTTTNDVAHSNPVNISASNTADSNNTATGAGSAMLGTTPFDNQQGLGSDGMTGQNDSQIQLPITLTLGQIDVGQQQQPSQQGLSPGVVNSPPNPASSNSNISNIGGTLKHVRHFIYGANRDPSAPQLRLELPDQGPFPAHADEEDVRRRKDKNGLFSLRLTPFIDHSATTNPGLFFEPIIRAAGPSSQLVIGRYTERVRESIGKIPEQFHPVVFKSKVVSRTHGCFKVDNQGNWYVKDVKSSSGTFLNHQRLAPASTMSKDVLLKDGDILQLGMDFRGGTEEIYRCVKMRVELNKSWKRRANAFNKEALQRLKNLQKLTTGSEEEDCSICLSKIKPCQAIFISPCSHSWHYQCVRRLVMTSYPQFVCPNCRSSCDLEASLDSDFEDSESDDENFGVIMEDVKTEGQEEDADMA